LNAGRAIAKQIQKLINEEIAKLAKFAVAFFWMLVMGADYKLQGAYHVICDLKSGTCDLAVTHPPCSCVALKPLGLHTNVWDQVRWRYSFVGKCRPMN
jgi:hypothetical protein